jgi:hypothetical protein
MVRPSLVRTVCAPRVSRGAAQKMGKRIRRLTATNLISACKNAGLYLQITCAMPCPWLAQTASPKNARLSRPGGYPSRPLTDPAGPNSAPRPLSATGFLYTDSRMPNFYSGKRKLLPEGRVYTGARRNEWVSIRQQYSSVISIHAEQPTPGARSCTGTQSLTLRPVSRGWGRFGTICGRESYAAAIGGTWAVTNLPTHSGLSSIGVV